MLFVSFVFVVWLFASVLVLFWLYVCNVWRCFVQDLLENKMVHLEGLSQ
jgi:hypothetical protein